VDYILKVPLDSGGMLAVEADRSEIPAELELAAARPGEVVAQASESLERSFERLHPAIATIAGKLRSAGSDKFTVEFGLLLGAEAGLVVAKGSSEVHFTVTLSWSRQADEP
jgi:Trypsin-co-occurring domain 1